ncbi:MAG TPA: hypothetical protein VMO88_14430 [Acidimicrobiales bacterium]|nr:hypothetical protein [Acidimicrobiales bacterium]
MIPTSVHTSFFSNRPAKTAPGYGRANTRPRTDPVATALAIAGLIAVAAIHLAQVVPTVKQTPYLGALFILLVIGCVGLAACLLESDRAEVWSAVAVLNGLAIAGYVFTRAVSSFIDNQDVGNWGETLGLVALLVEGVLILLSLHELRGQRIHRSARAVNPT